MLMDQVTVNKEGKEGISSGRLLFFYYKEENSLHPLVHSYPE